MEKHYNVSLAKEGFLAGPGVYASLAHTDKLIDKYFVACEKVFSRISNIISGDKNIKEFLDGQVCHAGFERLN